MNSDEHDTETQEMHYRLTLDFRMLIRDINHEVCQESFFFNDQSISAGEPDFQEKVLPVLWLAHRCESTPSHAGGQRRLLSPVGSSSLLVRVDRP